MRLISLFGSGCSLSCTTDWSQLLLVLKSLQESGCNLLLYASHDRWHKCAGKCMFLSMCIDHYFMTHRSGAGILAVIPFLELAV